MGYILILTISWLDILILQKAIYSNTGIAWPKFNMLNYFSLGFDEESLKDEMKIVLTISLICGSLDELALHLCLSSLLFLNVS